MKHSLKMIALVIYLCLISNYAFCQWTLSTNYLYPNVSTYSVGLGGVVAPADVLDVNGNIRVGVTGQFKVNGNAVLWNNNSTSNIFVGVSAGNSQSAALAHNTFTGFSAGYTTNGNITTSQNGYYNTFSGSYSGYSNTGNCNNAFGYQALYKNGTSFGNVAVGVSASYSNTTGDGNVSVGDSALQTNTTGDFNTAIGYKALYGNTTVTGNCALGYKALTANTTGIYNNAFGYNALATATTASYNHAFGYNALNANTSGYGNIAMGYNTLAVNTTGSFNTAVGTQALQTATTASYCAAFGFDALTFNTTGNYSSASGYYALFNNTTGNHNTAHGYNALFNNTTGSYNIATGGLALYTVTTNSANVADGYEAGYYQTGERNTAVGHQALLGAAGGGSTGADNVAVGYQAGSANTSGSNNTYVGYAATANAGNVSNSTAIGNGASATGSNYVAVGNAAVTTIAGQVNFTTYPSDSRCKKDISEAIPGIEFIKKLRPVTYHLDMNQIALLMGTPDSLRDASAETTKGQIRYTGFIAQEVEQAANAVGYDFSGVDKPKTQGGMYGLRYSEFVVPIVKALQEQQKVIDSLKTQINQLSGVGHRQSGQTQNGLSGSDQSNAIVSSVNVQLSNSIVLDQNVPNPFAEQTIITYNLPAETKSAQILFYDSDGRLIKTVDIKNTGKGQLNVFAQDLSSGVYSYTLVIDGKIYDTKRMIKQN